MPEYTEGEARAIIGPMLGFDPEAICGYAFVAITHEGEIQCAGNGSSMGSAMLLQGAAEAVLISAAIHGERDQELVTEPEPNPLESVNPSADALIRELFGE
jgi:hypothetical protein